MIHWLLQSLDDCPEIARGAAPAGWLCEQEVQRLSTLKMEKRRRDWLLGRWTAKQLVQGYLAETAGAAPLLEAIQIANCEDGSPYCLVTAGEGQPAQRLPLSLSISHSHGHAFCALCRETNGEPDGEQAGRWSLGCDIEYIEPREQSFVNDFFAAEEIRSVMATPVAQRDSQVTAIWSAKESVLKSLRTGLRIDTRRIVCRFAPGDPPAQAWSPLAVGIDTELATQFPGGWSAWWQVQNGFVLTMTLREEGAQAEI